MAAEDFEDKNASVSEYGEGVTDRLARRTTHVHRPRPDGILHNLAATDITAETRWGSRPETDGVMSEPANKVTSDHEMARAQAKTNLLQALYSHVSHDLEQTRAEANRLRLELGALRGEFEQTHRHLGEARAEVERVHGQLNHTLNERDRLTVRIQELQQQHDVVMNSTSWRVTAPIRALTRVMKRQ
jgi:predicted RNase H-like nuclease (RuvC/YqgF family)